MTWIIPFLLLIMFLNVISQILKSIQYNGGRCTVCQNQLEYNSTEHYSDGSWEDYYTCPTCENEIVKPTWI